MKKSSREWRNRSESEVGQGDGISEVGGKRDPG